MALKFMQAFEGEIIYPAYEDREWKVVLRKTAQPDGDIIVEKVVNATDAGQGSINFAPTGNFEFLIPVNTTVSRVELQVKKTDNNAWVGLAYDTVTSGFYEFGGIFEITNLIIEHNFPTG